MFAFRFSVVVSLLVVVAAFTKPSSQRMIASKKTELRMAVWGVQKLGQSVVDQSTVSAPPEKDSESFFKRATVGAGTDDRVRFSPEQEEEDWATLSRLDKALNQKDLLMVLESPLVGVPQKLERTYMAAKVENLLPSSFAAEASTSNIRAGGLMDEWDL